VAHPPFDPEAVVADFARELHRYRIYRLTGDRYGGAWVGTAFERHGIGYDPAPRSASDTYAELLPGINAGRVELLDSPLLRTQLLGLERRTRSAGRDSIDHARGSHDDAAAAVALVLVELLGARLDGDLGCTFGPQEPVASEGHVREDRERQRARDLQLIREAEARRGRWRRESAGPLERALLDGPTGLPDPDRQSIYDAPDVAQEG
jgi:hypothetical protein